MLKVFWYCELKLTFSTRLFTSRHLRPRYIKLFILRAPAEEIAYHKQVQLDMLTSLGWKIRIDQGSSCYQARFQAVLGAVVYPPPNEQLH